MFWLISAALAAPGALSALVFDGAGGPPLAGTVVTVTAEDGTVQQATTDELGAVLLDLDPGSWTLSIAGTTTSLVVYDGETTEVLVSVSPEGARFDVEQPAGSSQVDVPQDVARGTLVGRVVDEDGTPVVGARIFVRGQTSDATSDEDGRFSLEVAAGTVGLSVLQQGYATRTLEVEVPADGEASVEVELIEAGLQLADFYVEYPELSGGTASLLAERRTTADVVDAVSAEEMSRRGDSSAAAALRRVTGLTVVGGKYVYVRGLGERYSSTLLNGSTLPSPDPERRVVPLDLFPTTMLESVVIQKTYSASMPGEFGGGVVRLRTRGIPDDPLFRVSLGGKYVQGTTFANGLMADRGPTDWLGIDGGHRALPETVEQVTAAEPLVIKSQLPDARGVSVEDLERVGEAMKNRWDLQSARALPDMNGSVVAGRGWDLSAENRFGLLGGLIYRNSWEYREYTDRFFGQDGEDFQIINEYDFRDLTNRVRLGGIVVAELESTENSTITSTSLVTRDSEALGRRYLGENDDIGDIRIRVERGRWVERMLFVEQLAGEHTVPAARDLQVRWRYALSRAWRDEPDRRDVILEPTGDRSRPWTLRTQGGGNGIFFSDLRDTNHDAGLDVVLPLGPREEHPDWTLDLGAGLAMYDRRREVGTRRFNYDVRTGPDADASFLDNEPGAIFTADNIGPDALQIGEATVPTDNYTASQVGRAAYLQVESRTPTATTVQAGARYDASVQNVTTFALFSPTPQEINANLDTGDVLPSLTVTQELTKEDAPTTMQVRAGYGRTLNRPDFRELSPATFNDVVGGRVVEGNPELQRALIDNFDLRWELYPSSQESVSVGAFYKRFTDPIETRIIVSAASKVTFANAESASNVGVEADFRKALDFGSGSWAQDLFLSANASFIRSRVDLGDVGGNQTNTVRPLQGQSPWVVNGQLSYEPIEFPVSGALLYNAFGPRIVEVGEGGLPDTIELPQHRLDAVSRVRTGKGWVFAVSGKNLLNAPTRLVVGPATVREVRAGWEVGASVTWSPEAP